MRQRITRVQTGSERSGTLERHRTQMGSIRKAVSAAQPLVRGLRTKPEVLDKVRTALSLNSRAEAEVVLGAAIRALEETLAENIASDGYYIKVGSFGKFSIRHRLGTVRKIPLTGETKMTRTKRKVRFVALGRLRQLEKVGSGR